ncbi:suppressor of fused domain protein [Actinomadura rugatobispora]|uniref:Suppressor of fused domain protein n=1 Tax=Actinomadura rugatobispora TaxID=1994 RepID=A0ABW1AGJ2_9ACTN
MTPPLDDPYFTALHKHVTPRLGPGYAYARPVDDEGIGVGMHRLNPLQITAITLGLPFQPGAKEPAEFACSLQSDQEREAHYLVRLAARWFLKNDEASVGFGEWIQSGEPMIDGTGIHGLLFDTFPHGTTTFSVFDGAVWPDGGEGTLQIFAVVPLTAPEIEVLEDPGQGVEALWTRWREEETEIWNARRE